MVTALPEAKYWRMEEVCQFPQCACKACARRCDAWQARERREAKERSTAINPRAV